MKNYFKKFLAGFLIIAIFFPQITGISIFYFLLSQPTQANFIFGKDLVAIFVEDEIYDDVKNEVSRYASDISGALSGASTIILPFPQTATAYDLSILSKSLYSNPELYLTGSENLNLIGSVFVGNTPIPEYQGRDSVILKTTLPYVDFVDQQLLFDENLGIFKEIVSIGKPIPEIWTSFISPYSESRDERIQMLKDYFEKNHNFYIGAGEFLDSKSTINGKIGDSNSSHTPYVFYFDQFRDNLSYLRTGGDSYTRYLENREDIVYNRFTKELANKIKGEAEGSYLSGLQSFVDTNFPEYEVSDDAANFPDISARYIISKGVGYYYDIFNTTTIGEARTSVNNAGRYSGLGGEINVDSIQHIAATLDTYSDELIKDANTKIENYVDNLVENNLSRKMAIQTGVNTDGCSSSYTNYFYGKTASSITTAADCTIYRGNTENSGKLIQATRGLNVDNVENDVQMCIRGETKGYWGGASPINLNIGNDSSASFSLKENNPKLAIRPIFDLKGSIESKNSANNPSPLNCYQGSMILTRQRQLETIQSGDNDRTVCRTTYQIPDNNGNGAIGWTCNMTNISAGSGTLFEVSYVNVPTPSCGTNTISLDSKTLKSITNIPSYGNGDDRTECSPIVNNSINYKSINSVMYHKSPTQEEIKAQIEAMITQDLPIDKVRYVDFIGATGNYGRYDYPNLFTILSDNPNSLNTELQNLLNNASNRFNTLKNTHDPKDLTGTNLEIYNLLKKGEYLTEEINLLDFLNNLQDSNISTGSETSEFKYIDNLKFALYWKNIKTINEKHAFVIDNYLKDLHTSDNNFFLPKSKSTYEIAYLAAKGESDSMFVDIGEYKSESIPEDIKFTIEKNTLLKTQSLTAPTKISNSTNKSKQYDCGPPDGVPLFQWPAAISCWVSSLSNLQVFGPSQCGTDILELGNPRNESINTSSCGDFNGNGIADCFENSLSGATLEISSPQTLYPYRTSSNIFLELKDSSGNLLTSTRGNHSLKLNLEKLVDSKTGEIIFDASTQSFATEREKINSYVTLFDGNFLLSSGKGTNVFTTKSKDAIFTIHGKFELKDNNGNIIKEITSESLTFGISDLQNFIQSSKIFLENNSQIRTEKNNSVKASNENNLFLTIGKINSKEASIYTNSSAKEKLVFALPENTNFAFPIKAEILNENGEKVLEKNVSNAEIRTFSSLGNISKSGKYSVKLTDNNNVSVSLNFEINPETASDISLNFSSNFIEKNSYSTGFLELKDIFGNVTFGIESNIRAEISGNSLDFYGEKTKEFLVSDGSQIFQIDAIPDEVGKSVIKFSLLDENGNLIKSVNEEIGVYEKVNISSNIATGQINLLSENEIEVSVLDNSGNIISDANGVLYATINSSYGELSQNSYEIENGKAKINLKTFTKANENASLDLSILGINFSQKEFFQILPNAPARIDLSSEKRYLKAQNTEKTRVSATLKDMYGNTVFTDNSSKLTISSRNPEILQTSGEKIVSKGNASFEISATNKPGVGYISLKSNVINDLNVQKIYDYSINLENIPESFKENNSLNSDGNIIFTENEGSLIFKKNVKTEIYNDLENLENISNSDKNIILELFDDFEDSKFYKLAENFIYLETYFTLDKEDIAGNAYNAIYTSLIGADYGNITKEYLAGSLLFDKDNRSLAVTSTLNPYFSESKIFSLNNSGNSILTNYNLKLGNASKLDKFILIDSSQNEIGKIDLKYSNLSLQNCENNCELNADIQIQKSGNSIINGNSSKVSLYDNSSQILFEIFANGEMNFAPNVNLEFIKNSSNFSFNIKNGNAIIGILKINNSSFEYLANSEENIYTARLNASAKAIGFFSFESDLKISANNSSGKNIYFYKNLETSDNYSNIGNSYENISNEAGIGWKDGNKTLLLFASGQSVGESTKKYYSPQIINLGDPVLKLKSLGELGKNTRNFDRTLGKELSTASDIVKTIPFDYDNNDYKDLLSVGKDGSVYLNKNNFGEFSGDRKIAFLPNIGEPNAISVGDFDGDGFQDIFYKTTKDQLIIIKNNETDFDTFDITPNFEGKKILFYDIFDMDNDGKSDIVFVDSSYKVWIYYSESNSADITENFNFTKKEVGELPLPELKTSSVSTGGFLSYASFNSGNISEDLEIYTFLENNAFINLPYLIEGNLGIETAGQTIPNQTFVKSDFADLYGIEVSKTFKDLNAGKLQIGDLVETKIILKNISTETFSNISYIESSDNLLNPENSSIKVSKTSAKIIENFSKYDFLINNFDLAPNEEIEIIYNSKVRDFRYGKLEVGLFEKGESGDDLFGDIKFLLDSEACLENGTIFKSISAREYAKQTFSNNVVYDTVNSFEEEVNNLDKMSEEEAKIYAEEKLKELNLDSDGDGIPDSEDRTPGYNFDGNTATNFMGNLGEFDRRASQFIDHAIQGFGCGFGGGSCINTFGLNWAPLAPGNDPVFMGKLIGDGLKVDEGIPVFSALTGIQATCGLSPCCLPAVFPASSRTYIPGPFCGGPGAGGRLGVNSPTNTIRVFVTPTLTGAVGTAVCFGGPASLAGNSVPKGVSPLIPGGNCIIAAAPLPLSVCQGDGSDGNATLVTKKVETNSSYEVFDASCNLEISTETEITGVTREYIRAKKGGFDLSETAKNTFSKVARGTNGPRGTQNSTKLLNIDGGSGNTHTIDFEFNSFSDFGLDYDFVPGAMEEEIELQSTPAFPNFFMDWVTRQTEEFANLLKMPNITIILPDFSGFNDGKMLDENGNFVMLDNIQNSYREGQQRFDAEQEEKSSKISELQSEMNSLGCGGIANGIRCLALESEIFKLQASNNFATRTASSMDSVYEFLGSTPLLNLETEEVVVYLPMFDTLQAEKLISNFENTKNQWNSEIARFEQNISNYCVNVDVSLRGECEENAWQIGINARNTLNSIEKNIKTIEGYKKLPEQLADLFNKKEEYLEQIACNLEEISESTVGWFADNGKRARAWADAYVTMKAVLQSWQMFVNLFTEYEESCHECKNERNDSIGSQFQLISAVLPKIPVVQIPRLIPDIVIDLHNIRAGMTVKIPDITVRTRPIVLPNLPTLSLPTTPDINFNLPSIPQLPSFNFSLELPDLPNLPSLNFPDLPPPPKIPKIMGGISGMVSIGETITQAMCIMKKSPFVPEWRAGDQIAFITERKGNMSLDFLNMSMPQFSFPTVDEIRVSTFVNLELEVDLTAPAEAIVEPINSFSNNLISSVNFSSSNISVGTTIPDLNIDVLPAVSNASLIGFETEELEFYDDLTDAKKDLVKLASNLNLPISKQNELYKITDELLEETIENEKRFDEIDETFYKNLDNTNKALAFERERNQKQLQNITDFMETGNYVTEVSSSSVNPFLQNQKTFLENSSILSQNNFILPQTDLSSLKYLANNSLNANPESISVGQENSVNSANLHPVNYNYKGVYIKDESGVYRLFEYVNEIRGKINIVTFDYDNDSDDDIAFVYNGKVYLKENYKNSPTKIQTSLDPIVVNIANNPYFKGEILQNEIYNVSSNSKLNEKISVNFETSNNSADGYKFELFTKEDSERIVFNSIFQNPENFGENNFSKQNNIGNIVLAENVLTSKVETKVFKNIKEDIDNEILVSLFAGNKLYANAYNDFKIKYYVGNNEVEEFEVSVSRGENIVFRNDIRIFEITGNAFVETNERNEYIGEEIQLIRGMPILNSTKITIGENENPAIFTNISLNLGGKIETLREGFISYYEIDLIQKNGNSVRFYKTIENDIYYGIISPISFTKKTFSHKFELLAPSLQNDNSFPQIDLNSYILTEVGKPYTIDLKGKIFDNSAITDVWIDLDLEIDSDNDFNAGNDRSNGVIFDEENFTITIPAYDEVLEKSINIWVQDDNYNKTFKTLNFSVQTPQVAISRFSENTIYGNIINSSSEQNVGIFRFRNGEIDQVGENEELNFSENGSFSFAGENSEIVEFFHNSAKAFELSEKTGKVISVSPGFSYQISLNDLNYPKLILSKDSEELYSSIFRNSSNSRINSSGEYDKDDLNVFVNENKYSYQILPENIALNAGAIVIYETANPEKTLTILKDSRIIPSGIIPRLAFSSDNKLGFIITDLTNAKVAEIIFPENISFFVK